MWSMWKDMGLRWRHKWIGGDQDLVAVPVDGFVRLLPKVVTAHALGVQLASGLLSKRLDALSPLDDGVGFGGERQRPDRHPHTEFVDVSFPIFIVYDAGVRVLTRRAYASRNHLGMPARKFRSGLGQLAPSGLYYRR